VTSGRDAMQTTHPTPVIPRRALIGIGSGLALCLAGVVAFRVAGYSTREPDAAAIDERHLRFVDRSDGGIDVVDAKTAVVIDTVHGEQGFLRGTLRGLARERRRSGLGADAPLVLVARADGRLTLTDPLTGQRIDLESFGPTNAAVYARWMSPSPTRKDTR